jgi:hypothetical protein
VFRGWHLMDPPHLVVAQHHRANSNWLVPRLNVRCAMSSVCSQKRTGGIGGTVQRVTKTEIVAIVLAFISIFVVMTAGFRTVWLTSEVRKLGLVMLPAAIVALLLVSFEWRAKLRNRILADRDDHKWAA